MLKRTWPALAGGLCAWTGMSGCDGSDNARSRYSAGDLAGDATVSQLDDAQLQQACEAYDVYIDTYVDLDAVAYVACLPQALLLSFDAETCEQRLAGCMALFPAPIRIGGTARVDACVQDLRTCGATVGDFEACVNGNVDLADSSYSCRGAGDQGYLEAATGLVGVCSRIDAVCDPFEFEGPQ